MLTLKNCITLPQDFLISKGLVLIAPNVKGIYEAREFVVQLLHPYPEAK
jgi:hypothetical protein